MGCVIAIRFDLLVTSTACISISLRCDGTNKWMFEMQDCASNKP